ncbi:MAG: DUF2293 domain-containing protein [Verrucomicrobia subdivision 3 bacterium]|nr:DUF2293 domain-containing protein [Limisphaerales bacterium]
MTRNHAKAATKPRSDLEEIVVFMVRRQTKCADCGKELFGGSLLRMEANSPLCLECADLGHLEFLGSGNTALTRRATKYSPLRAVVVRWSRTRNRYERQGILVTSEAIERAEAECSADEESRARQRERAAARREVEDQQYESAVAEKLKALFPGCPAEEAMRIAAWTCRKGSGRVGRSAAAKDFDQQALRLAVIAHIRHEHTRYDELLMRQELRGHARELVRDEIDQVLARWERPAI